MTHARVPMGFYEIDRRKQGDPLIVPVAELAEWCAKHGVEPKLYAEGWQHHHRKDPDEVILDIEDPEKLLLFMLAF